MDCIFCSIIKGEIPSKKAYEDDLCLAFYDIEPQAPVHILVIPKRHLASADELTAETAPLAAHILAVVPKIAKEAGLASYRIVSNVGDDARQSVKHLHFHILGGKVMNAVLA